MNSREYGRIANFSGHTLTVSTLDPKINTPHLQKVVKKNRNLNIQFRALQSVRKSDKEIQVDWIMSDNDDDEWDLSVSKLQSTQKICTRCCELESDFIQVLFLLAIATKDFNARLRAGLSGLVDWFIFSLLDFDYRLNAQWSDFVTRRERTTTMSWNARVPAQDITIDKAEQSTTNFLSISNNRARTIDKLLSGSLYIQIDTSSRLSCFSLVLDKRCNINKIALNSSISLFRCVSSFSQPSTRVTWYKNMAWSTK